MHKSLTFIILSFFVSDAMASSAINIPQAQVMVVANPDATNNAMVSTNPDLSYQMMSNQTGVGTELILLKAKAAGQTDSTVTTGGMIQSDVTSNSNSNP